MMFLHLQMNIFVRFLVFIWLFGNLFLEGDAIWCHNTSNIDRWWVEQCSSFKNKQKLGKKA